MRKMGSVPISGGRAAAGASRARGAAQAMLAEADTAPERGGEVEVEDAERPAAARGAELEHLVEIAVVEAPVVADAHQRSAHHAFGRRGVERRKELRHVGLELAAFLQMQTEAVDRHVGDGVEAVEDEAVAVLELAL